MLALMSWSRAGSSPMFSCLCHVAKAIPFAWNALGIASPNQFLPAGPVQIPAPHQIVL